MRMAMVFVVFLCAACKDSRREAHETLSKIRDSVISAKQSCDVALERSESMMDSERDIRKIWAREMIAAKICLRDFDASKEDASGVVAAMPVGAKQYVEAAKLYSRLAESYKKLWEQRIICLSFPDNEDGLEEEYRCAEEAEKIDEESAALFLRAEAAYKFFTNSIIKEAGK